MCRFIFPLTGQPLNYSTPQPTTHADMPQLTLSQNTSQITLCTPGHIILPSISHMAKPNSVSPSYALTLCSKSWHKASSIQLFFCGNWSSNNAPTWCCFPLLFWPTKHSPSLQKASRSNPHPLFSNCVQNDIMSVHCCLASFCKKNPIVYYLDASQYSMVVI